MELGEYVTGITTFIIAGLFVASMFVLAQKPVSEAIKNEPIGVQLVAAILFFLVFTFVMYVLFT